MLHIIKEVLLVNLYWFSIALIGYGLLRLIKDKASARYAQAVDFVLDRHVISKVFMSFAFTASILSLGALVCYLLDLPVTCFVILYLALFIVGVGYLALLFVRGIFSTRDLDTFGLKGSSLLAKTVFLLLCGSIFVDFSLALYAKSHLALSSDAYVHLSRMVAILNEGFTVRSGFFGSLPESGYHMNLIYALYTVPAKLFNMQPSHIWEYSFGFFRLMQWMAIFTLAWHAITYWFKDKQDALLGASAITLFAIGFFSSTFFIASYPNQIALTWLALFVVALSSFEFRGGSRLPVLLTALLITMTHPTYALMSSMFVAFILSVRLVQYKKGWLKTDLNLRTFIATFLLLLIGPLRTALFPNRMTDAGFHIDDFPTLCLGPLSMKKPDSLFDGSFLYASLIILASVGLFYLLYRLRKDRAQFTLVLALVLFFPLIVYVPFVFTAMNKVLPMWVISRFAAMNALTFIAAPIGIFGVFHVARYIASRYAHPPRFVMGTKAAHLVPLAVVLTVSAYSLQFMPHSITKYHDENEHYYAFMDATYSSLHGVLKDNAMVVANEGDSYFLASVLPVDVLAIEEGHTTPSADVSDRIACEQKVMKNFGYADLKAINADYVVLSVYSPDYKVNKEKVDSLPYLKFETKDSNFLIYKFDKSKQPAINVAADKACSAFEKVEQS